VTIEPGGRTKLTARPLPQLGNWRGQFAAADLARQTRKFQTGYVAIDTLVYSAAAASLHASRAAPAA